jgi:DNA-binding PadR family transcriptional regulator
LAETGLIEETERTQSDPADERRRYYLLTRRGRAVLKREAETLSKVLRFAKSKRVI